MVGSVIMVYDPGHILNGLPPLRPAGELFCYFHRPTQNRAYAWLDSRTNFNLPTPQVALSNSSAVSPSIPNQEVNHASP
jgi:hypothetical protein